jgi:hypothetical protein
MDLAVANRDSENISILLNNGNGTFGAKVDYAAGEGAGSVFSSDLDGDGDMDLVAANLNSDSISVLLNNGNGTFAPKADYGAGNTPQSVFSSDLDGDGDMDLAVANAYSEDISVLLNIGPIITVTSPNGGEKWRTDSTCFITWTSIGTSGTVNIEYSTDNGSTWTEIVEDMPDVGVIPWVIPDTPSDSCLIKISEEFSSDTSDAVFSILPVSGVPDNGLPSVYSMSLKTASIDNKLEVIYALPVRTCVKLSLYDIQGVNVKKIVEEKPAGYHSMEIDMNNSPKGVYFLRIEANDFVKISKAVLM